MRDPVFLTEGDQRVIARSTQPGLEAARHIVNAGMEDTAVAPGLVPAPGGLLFEEHCPGTPVALAQRHRGGQSDDAAPDDGVIEHPVALTHGRREVPSTRPTKRNSSQLTVRTHSAGPQSGASLPSSVSKGSLPVLARARTTADQVPI